MKIYHLILILCLGFGALQAQDETSRRFSLQEAQSYAIQHNTQVRNALLDSEIAKKKVWETTATGLPQVTASAGHNYNIDLPVTLIPAEMLNPFAEKGTYMEMKFGTDHNTSLNLQVNQLIFSGAYIVGLKAAKIYRQLSENQLKKTEKELTEQVANTYLLILMAEERLKVLDKNIASTQSLYRETNALFKAGLASEIDASQLKINLGTFQNAQKNAKRQIQVIKDLLKIQLGLPKSEELLLTDNLEMLLNQSNILEMNELGLDLDKHYDYKLISTQEHLQKLNMDKEKTTFLPTLSAFYSHQESMMDNDFKVFSGGKWYGSNIVGLKLDLPIFSSGQRLSRVSQARLELEKVRNLKAQLADNLSVQVLKAKLDMETAYEGYQLQKENKNLSQKIYREYESKYKNGMASSLELTQSQMQYLNNEQAYFQSIFDLLDAQNKLKKALGL